MVDPIFWLGLSILLVAVSLTAVLVVALPALKELARAARSAEKLFDTLSRELPPTLEAIRLTGLEISDLTDEVSEGVQSASQAVQQVNQSITSARQRARQAQVTTRSVFAGVKAAWKVFQRPPQRRSMDRLPPGSRNPVSFEEPYPPRTSLQRQGGYDENLDNYYDDEGAYSDYGVEQGSNASENQRDHDELEAEDRAPLNPMNSSQSDQIPEDEEKTRSFKDV